MEIIIRFRPVSLIFLVTSPKPSVSSILKTTVSLLWTITNYGEREKCFVTHGACTIRAFRELFIWMLVCELTSVIIFTIYSINSLSRLPLKAEAMIHLSSLALSLLIFGKISVVFFVWGEITIKLEQPSKFK